jgi:hypothetical protein
MKWMGRLFLRLTGGWCPRLVDLPTGAGKTDLAAIWVLALSWYGLDSASRDFGGLDEYARFLKDLFAQRNAVRRARLAEELAVMGELPERRMESAKLRPSPSSVAFLPLNVCQR